MRAKLQPSGQRADRVESAQTLPFFPVNFATACCKIVGQHFHKWSLCLAKDGFTRSFAWLVRTDGVAAIAHP